MILEKALALIQQDRINEAMLLLNQARNSSLSVQGVELLWGKIAATTPFPYLGIIALKNEAKNFSCTDANNFIENLYESIQNQKKENQIDLPLISLVGVITESNIEPWIKCIDSLNFQIATNYEICLSCDKDFNYQDRLPASVNLLKTPLGLNPLEFAIRSARGEFISVISNPDTIFHINGLFNISILLKNRPDIFVLQTGIVAYNDEGLFKDTRNYCPEWSQSLLLDVNCLEEPTLLFDWPGVFFRRNFLITKGLPLSENYENSQALFVATKLIKESLFHSIRYPVVLLERELSYKSIKLPLKVISDSIEVITLAKKACKDSISFETNKNIEPMSQERRKGDISEITNNIILIKNQVHPKISLVTPTYNGADYLEACIDSILSQKYPNLEYSILDGGSKDESVSIIKKYEKYLYFWRSHSDNGHYSAVNEGLNKSTGEIMGWLNSDDSLTPYCFELISSIFNEKKQVSWITGTPCIQYKDDAVEIFDKTPVFDPTHYFNDGFDEPFIQQEGTFWRRNLWVQSGGTLDLRFDLAADMELWTRFFQFANLYTTTVPLGIFRERIGQRSAIFRSKYYVECVNQIKKIKLNNIKPFPVKDDLIIKIPLVNSD
jgi:hypothetical protein